MLKIGTLASILVLLAGGLPVEAAPFAYVADFGSGVVSVIDLETNTEIVKISTPSLAPPYHVAVTPDGARVYVSSGFFGGTVTVIDTITNRVVVPEIIVGPGAGGLAVSPDGKFVYVAIRQHDKVSVISTATHQVVATIPVGAFPNDVAVTPDGSRVYVASHSNAMTVIDTSNHTVMTSISVAPHSEEIVVSPDGSELYVSSTTAETVSVIDPTSNTVSATIAVGFAALGMAVTPDGTRLYVVDTDEALLNGSVAVIDTATKTLLTRVTLPPSHNPRRIALSPDGTRALVTINSPQRVLVIDTAKNVVIGQPIRIEGIPESIAVSPPPPAGPLPPVELRASLIAGNQVTLRWTPRATTVKPTGYVVEGGLTPGQVLASIPTGSTTPSFTFIAPTGAFYVRIHAVAGGQRSAASNEIQLFVNVPAVPSPPANLLGLISGSNVWLAWRNTYGGGAPTSLRLDVTGPLLGSVPLPPVDTFSGNGIPPGTYTVRLRAVSSAGTSAPSNPVTIAVPMACSALPHVPVNFLVTRAGNVISVTWDSPDSGGAVTGFVLVVSGAFDGEIPLSVRTITAAVGSGSYTLGVYATNPCGRGPTTARQTIVVP